MTEKPPSKDEALEALDFIVNVLKEHEKDLDRLVCELGNVAGQLGDSGELSGKVKKIEDKINGLQNDVTNLIKSFPSSPNKVAKLETEGSDVESSPKIGGQLAPSGEGLPLVLKCKQWSDFLMLATQAQTVSYALLEGEKAFQVNAFKNNRVITYGGEMPKMFSLLKIFLSRSLGVSESQVLEGDMALG